MSLPLKRKRESSPESTGIIASSSHYLGRGGHTSRGHANSRGPGRSRGRGRGRSRGRGRGRSFHIPRRALQTALLTELWKHRTDSTYAFSGQFGPVPPSPPTINLEPGVIAETPQLLHSPANTNPPQNLDDFVNSSEYQDSQSIHPPRVHRPNGPRRQTHQNKRQNQASIWMDRMIPLLLEPFMDLLRRTKSGRVSVSPPAPKDGACSCSSVALKITCVSWNRKRPPVPTDSSSNCILQALKTTLSVSVTVAQPLSNS